MSANAAIMEVASTFEDIDPKDVKALSRPEPLVKASRLAWLRFEKPNLAQQQRFLEDFGLLPLAGPEGELYARGAGDEPFIYHAKRGAKSRFVSIGLVVDQRAELERLAALPGASDIREEPGPGGGSVVTLRDPNGFKVEFVFGRRPVAKEPPDAAAEHLWNHAYAMHRPNQSARPPLEPARVQKLGHVVIQCYDVEKTLNWWMRHAGLIISDAQVLDDGSVNLAFCRLDCGATPTDHHSVAIVGGIGALYMHSAWEVQDFDAVGQGQQVLKAGGWRHGWGIGRHYYGSQIFDYWRDPFGHLMEHYTDGDMFDADVPTRYSRFSRASTWMWGQDQPKDFEGMSFAALLLMARNLISGKISGARVALLMRALKARPRPWFGG
jgi:catechol 2,3-dioxygenase-like lactoylglutathione lyase family enzyme